MEKLFFRNDYSEGACAAALNAVCAVNMERNIGYGEDGHSSAAKAMIRTLCACPDATVEFFIGGTNVNAVAIAALLRPWEGVISPESGHINGHESGAVESYGHKIITVKTAADGKLLPEQIPPVMDYHQDTHLVKPRLVYISNATERGAVYTRAELTALYEMCEANDLLLFIDGARLGVALASPENDLTFADMAALSHAFTIGGTKNGMLMGEALVIVQPQPELFRIKKQRGGVLAKGFLLGAQFEVLMAHNAALYLENAGVANDCAQALQKGLQAMNIPLFNVSPTNQIFPIVPNAWLESLREFVEYEIWEPLDDGRTAIRFVCSFASSMDKVEALLEKLSKL